MLYCDTLVPSAGITRIRFKGYDLSLLIRHPYWKVGTNIMRIPLYLPG